MYEIVIYMRDSGSCPFKEFLQDMSQTSHNQKQLEQIILYTKKLEEYGMNIGKYFVRDAVKKLESDLYELRPAKVRIFFTITKGKFVFLHAYRKKSQKTPPREIENARQEIRDHKRQLGDS